MKSTYLLTTANVVLLLGTALPARAAGLYNASSGALLEFSSPPPTNTVISIDPGTPGNQIIEIEESSGLATASATADLSNVDNLLSIQAGDFLQTSSIAEGASPPSSESLAQATIGIFFRNLSDEDVVFEFLFSYDLATGATLDDPSKDSANAFAEFAANFGYGFVPGGPTPPSEVPIENILERVFTNEAPISVVGQQISFPVPAQTLGAVSFTSTALGNSNSATVPEPMTILGAFTAAGLGAVLRKAARSKSGTGN